VSLGRRARSTAALLAAVTASASALATSCRSAQRPAAPATPSQAVANGGELKPPVLRIGILTEAPRVSIGADGGVVVRESQAERVGRRSVVPRATFKPVAENGVRRVRLIETGEDFVVAEVAPQNPDELESAGPATYRGHFEVRADPVQGLTVANVVNLEDYLRGVVPNELSPILFPELEALKAQAVAARTYALRNMGQFQSKGYDLCATPACQVYKGKDSEHPLTDRAVQETAGITASFNGELINAVYTSTCGGHTEDGVNILEGEPQPYLRGVVCAPERNTWGSLRTTASREALGPEEGLNRDVAMLRALGVVEPRGQGWLKAPPAEAEVRGWLRALLAALHRGGCAASVEPPLARRASFFEYAVMALCWDERARRLLAPGDPEYLMQVEDRAAFAAGPERLAAALLLQEGVLVADADNRLRPNEAISRAQALQVLAGLARRAGAVVLVKATFKRAGASGLVVERDGEQETYAVDPAAALFRTLDGRAAAASELNLVPGDSLGLIAPGGRVVYLEVEQSRNGNAFDRGSRYYRWEQRLTPAEVAKGIARYGNVGEVRDVEVRRLGVSGRVIEAAIVGSKGELLLRGLRIRWGLSLRENLFVIDRERSEDGGAVARFVFTGKGWGHGVGLCQVGAYGMAQAGAGYEEILKHYYTGVRLEYPRE
jgi:stage II sporulation protein D